MVWDWRYTVTLDGFSTIISVYIKLPQVRNRPQKISGAIVFRVVARIGRKSVLQFVPRTSSSNNRTYFHGCTVHRRKLALLVLLLLLRFVGRTLDFSPRSGGDGVSLCPPPWGSRRNSHPSGEYPENTSEETRRDSFSAGRGYWCAQHHPFTIGKKVSHSNSK